ncbi:tRNA (guanosine(37)-N1)-methyltransferase TrmD [Bifidobacterium polysaccharolyticum]|uniref:tRNA (guanosine(37)-N1)-methyltransferase TrmD n=1 Tax=Bifidobacterium polysaccharolyticum TaxID=2750967 RepID=UPI0018DB8182|nr:tRNA (guanosine(37)-N1)-methyltransferase TrmD [Bifidobacterium polysaccharolyticum]MBI0064608.1 tRNA (guanosine(37)-N1)-methyltransferase TrmD [Bifidobacterium polysaccharolyticum]MCT8157755.1 tRNA (guanosine(37)-N1)-methyltransferase TrmD [Bifidobacterium polysaccharolyticum]
MQIDIVSVFPEYFDVTGLSLLGKAQEKGLVTIRAHNLRNWTHDVHHSVDDTPVGGGAGMVMKPEVWGQCLDDLLDMPDGSALQLPTMDHTTDTADTEEEKEAMKSSGDKSHGIASEADLSADSHEADLAGPVLIFPNPSAPLFTQADATELSRTERLIFGCGRYEGYDARIPDYYRNQGIDVREYSIGDYVLNGGEVAVSVMLEAITRLLPGFMGNPESIVQESYTGDEPLLEYRQYTRPTTWRGMAVPEILTSGDHGKVDRFRRDEAIRRTSRIRPDLIARLDCSTLDKHDRRLLEDLGWGTGETHPRPLDQPSN